MSTLSRPQSCDRVGAVTFPESVICAANMVGGRDYKLDHLRGKPSMKSAVGAIHSLKKWSGCFKQFKEKLENLVKLTPSEKPE